MAKEGAVLIRFALPAFAPRHRSRYPGVWVWSTMNFNVGAINAAKSFLCGRVMLTVITDLIMQTKRRR